MLKVTNLDAVERDIDRWLEQVEQQVEHIAKAIAIESLIHGAYNSPQYSGDFVANWKLSVNQPDRTFTEGIFPEKGFPAKHPFIRGDSPAIAYAMGQAQGRLDGFKLGDTIWLANSAVHHDLYAWKIENNRIKFRIGNIGAPLQHTFDYLRARYGVINKGNLGGLMGVSV